MLQYGNLNFYRQQLDVSAAAFVEKNVRTY